MLPANVVESDRYNVFGAKDTVEAISKHRDQWREYAYGRGKRPHDFMWPSGSRAIRKQTLIEHFEGKQDRIKTQIEKIEEACHADKPEAEKLRRVLQLVRSLGSIIDEETAC